MIFSPRHLSRAVTSGGLFLTSLEVGEQIPNQLSNALIDLVYLVFSVVLTLALGYLFDYLREKAKQSKLSKVQKDITDVAINTLEEAVGSKVDIILDEVKDELKK